MRRNKNGQTGVQDKRELKLAAVNEVRSLNTAERAYRDSHGRFADLEELKSSDDGKKHLRNTAAEEQELVASYDISVIADLKRRHIASA